MSDMEKALEEVYLYFDGMAIDFKKSSEKCVTAVGKQNDYASSKAYRDAANTIRDLIEKHKSK